MSNWRDSLLKARDEMLLTIQRKDEERRQDMYMEYVNKLDRVLFVLGVPTRCDVENHKSFAVLDKYVFSLTNHISSPDIVVTDHKIQCVLCINIYDTHDTALTRRLELNEATLSGIPVFLTEIKAGLCEALDTLDRFETEGLYIKEATNK